MMLASSGSGALRRGAADTYDAGWFGFWRREEGLLMLKMLDV